jgi:pilus assembly protein CpaB
VRPQSLIAAALALVLGCSAALGVNALLRSRKASTQGPASVPVIVAATDIPRGGTITPDLITTREFPGDMVPAGAMMKPGDTIDRVVAIPLVRGEAVLEAKLAPRGAGRGLAALVPKGMRAVTIQTPTVATGVAGFVMPGNRVDVLLTVTDTGGANSPTGGGSTTTLLQRVEILAVDQKIDAPADNKVDAKELRSVTLLVTPRQANLLDLGQNKGTLHLALRNPGDDLDADGRAVTLADLRFHQEKPWDERVKSLLKAYAESRPAPSDRPPSPPAPASIRTLRGRHEGSVHVQAIAPSDHGRLGGN